MTTKQINKATKNMTLNQATYFIENCGLKLVAQENYPFCKSWSVLDNKEISTISATKISLDSDICDVKYCFNY